MPPPAYTGKLPLLIFPFAIVRPTQLALAPFPTGKIRNSGVPAAVLRWMVAPLPLIVRSRPAVSLSIAARPFAPFTKLLDRRQSIDAAGSEVDGVAHAVRVCDGHGDFQSHNVAVRDVKDHALGEVAAKQQQSNRR